MTVFRSLRTVARTWYPLIISRARHLSIGEEEISDDFSEWIFIEDDSEGKMLNHAVDMSKIPFSLDIPCLTAGLLSFSVSIATSASKATWTADKWLIHLIPDTLCNWFSAVAGKPSQDGEFLFGRFSIQTSNAYKQYMWFTGIKITGENQSRNKNTFRDTPSGRVSKGIGEPPAPTEE